MKRIIIYAAVMAFSLSSCSGQEQQKEQGTVKAKENPKTNIIVNKEYDDQGNIIRYDSTYSSFYSNIEGDTILRDSLFEQFRNQFNQKFFFSEDPFFKDLFFEDSLLPFDFYKEDYFRNRFRLNMERMDKLFWEMDSIKDKFFRDQFPDSLPRDKI